MRIFVSSELKAGKVNEYEHIQFYWSNMVNQFIVVNLENRCFFYQYSDALNLFNTLVASVKLKDRLRKWKQKAGRVEVV